MGEAATREAEAAQTEEREVTRTDGGPVASPLAGRSSGHAGLVLGLQRSAGNAAVVRSLPLLMRERSKAADASIKRDLDQALVFQTPSAKLGAIEVAFSGRLSFSGKATFENEKASEEDKKLAATPRLKAAAFKKLTATAPTGSETAVELDIGGQKLRLNLAPGLTGMPAFVVSGAFSAKGDLTFNEAEVKGAAIRIDATASVTPAASAPGTPPPTGSPSDATVAEMSFAGSKARFEPSVDDGPQRTGAVALIANVKKLESSLPAAIKDHHYFKLPEQRVAFLQHHRNYFGTDDETIAHFKGLRFVDTKNNPAAKKGLILHDEAAARLEAVDKELQAMTPAGAVPQTGIGWPRSECTLGTEQGIGNLHNVGFAVDFYPEKTPHIKDQRLKDLITLVTGKVEMATGSGWYTTGKYHDMEKKTEQRAEMADPTDATAEGKKLKGLLDKVESEATDAAARSEKFRGSLGDYTEADGTTKVKGADKLMELRKKFLAKTWGEEEKKAYIKLVSPWTSLAETQAKKYTQAVTDAGLTGLMGKDAKAIKADKDAVTSKAGAAGLKSADRTKRIAAMDALSKALGLGEVKFEDSATDEEIATKLKSLTEAAEKRKKGYADLAEYNRYERLRTSILDESFTFGPDAKDGAATNPALTQLVRRGFFSLSDPGGTGMFDLRFVKTMVKHGFMHGGTWDNPDFMHFELRWTGPKTK